MIGDKVEVTGVVKSIDNKQAVYHTSDPKASYTLVNSEAYGDDYNPSSVEWVDVSLVDYNLMASESLDAPRIAGGLPMSYLQIKTVREGTEWYKQNTRYPNEVCEMMAKYDWGDLKYTTKKEFKNLRKRVRKKDKGRPHLVAKHGPVLVHFD